MKSLLQFLILISAINVNAQDAYFRNIRIADSLMNSGETQPKILYDNIEKAKGFYDVAQGAVRHPQTIDYAVDQIKKADSILSILKLRNAYQQVDNNQVVKNFAMQQSEVLNSFKVNEIGELFDSIMKIRALDTFNIAKRSEEDFVARLTKRLDNDMKVNIVAKHLYDSTKNELKKMSPGASQYELTVFVFLRATLYYTWNLAGRGKDSLLIAKETLDEAAEFSKTIHYQSAIIYFGMSGLYNSYNNYYIKLDSNRRAFDAIKMAIGSAANAVRLNPWSYLYQRGLAVMLRNATYGSELLLPVADKVELARLSYRCIKNMEDYFPFRGNSITELYNSTVNLATRLGDAGYEVNAVDTIRNTIDILNQYIAKKVATKDAELNKLKLLIQASALSVDSLNDFRRGIQFLDESYALFTSIDQDTTGNADADRLVELNSSLDNVLQYARSKQDSVAAIKTFSAAIKAYEKIAPLGRAKYKEYSEDVYRFALPYVRRVELNNLRVNKGDADKDFAILEKNFFPLYYKYRFDFYLGQPLVRASKAYANYLCEQGKYKQALPLLKFASLEGVKESTDSLIAIYQKPGFANADSLKFYKFRTSYQSKGMKRFTVPTDFDGVKYPFHIYITDRAKEYDTLYTGIRDQVKWVWMARKGKIPEDVISSFDKLQKIAWENDVSFMELSVYALNASSKDSSKTSASGDSAKATASQNMEKLKKEMTEKNILSLLTLSRQYAGKNDYVAIDTIAREMKMKVGNLYNSLCWQSILLKKFDDAKFYLEEGFKYDPGSIFLKSNRPHVLLLTGNFEKAKTFYLDYKNVHFNKDYDTYKQAFLDDFKEFEKVGIVSKEINEIINLLNQQ